MKQLTQLDDRKWACIKTALHTHDCACMSNLLVDNTHAIASRCVNGIGFTPLQWAIVRCHSYAVLERQGQM